MLENLDAELRTDYRSGRDSLLGDFYIPCLSESTSYDRAVGYFRSSLLHVVALAYSDFVRRNGTMRLICSASITDEDYEAVKSGEEARLLTHEHIERELDALLQSPESLPATQLLATLVATGHLDVKVAFSAVGMGIFHDKLGIFEDPDGRRVTFVGSANETAAAWGMNHESFEVFASWRGEGELLRTRNHADFFDLLWQDKEPGVTVEPMSEVSRERLLAVADDDVETAMGRVQQHQARRGPGRGPRELFAHQLAVLDDWEDHRRRGIVAFATGAGKTLTAIEAIRRWTSEGRPALVLVPSRDLHRQWRTEMLQELPDARVLLCGAGHPPSEWGPLLRAFTEGQSPGAPPRIVLSTNQTFCHSDFQARVSRDAGGMLLVVDEMHRAGSPDTLEALERTQFAATLGLSATYRRQFDEAGTRRLIDCFGDVLDPVIGLAEAIAMGRLVPYDYRFHTLTLDDDELAVYENLSDRIRRLAGRESDGDMSDELRMLLIRRARTLKQARGKAPRAVEILQEEYRPENRWLVYCDSTTQLEDLISLGLDAGLPVLEYHSSMAGDRDAALASFRRRGGIVVAIRCLDEGVDIPVCDRALILASSTVAREYVQRRGRVLRTSEGKVSASVHDLILVDNQGGALTRSEVARALEFARLARNPGARAQLQLLLAQSADPVGAEIADQLSLGDSEEVDPE